VTRGRCATHRLTQQLPRGFDERAGIAAALGDAEKAVAVSGEGFHHIEERLAERLVERSEISIEHASAPRSRVTTREPPPTASKHR
jgi:hypothetical protein